MNLFDYLTGLIDLVKSRGSFDSMKKHAGSYVKQLDSKFWKKEQSGGKRRLAVLRKAIAPLEIQHERFQKAVEDRQREICQMTGISDESRDFLYQNTRNATIFTVERKGSKTVLDIDKILNEKKLICIEANTLIDLQNEKFVRLHTAYKYRLATYLRALNSSRERSEVSISMSSSPGYRQHWNYQVPYSSDIGIINVKEDEKNGNDNDVFSDVRKLKPKVAKPA